MARDLPSMIRGTYGHPRSFWERGLRLDDYGVNAVFIHGASLDQATVERARAEGCLVFAEFATLNGGYGDYVATHPEAHPIDDAGKPVEPATWFMGACPTDAGFRAYRLQALRDLLTQLPSIDGVWMDYLHWHAQFEDPYPIFAKTCFNSSCLTAFQRWSGVTVPDGEVKERSEWIFMHAARQWEDWRVSVLADWARQIHEIVKEHNPQALVGNYQVAWKDEDLAGVRRRCLGLDFTALAPYVDVYSPMIYHGRSGKTPEYIAEYVDYFGEQYNLPADGFPRLWPIVQAHDEPRIEPEEFARVLTDGSSGRSTGIMMFTLDSVAKDPGKLEAMRRVYHKLSAAAGE
ncbi:MAG: hypothetical protein HN712_05865 [Gemmatimonadetes bacterium]|jgi:hypothetical protein|nr:hypothetical protein [Gemmatimonadota bacterium]MBT7859817.1 hypothetical protein [Gemmatimonadota bacterium]